MKEVPRSFPNKINTPKILASIASSIVAFALSRGISMQEIESSTGLSGLDLMDPEARLPDDVGNKIWATIAQQYPDKALSIEMARAAPFSSLGGLAHGMQYASDLKKALELLVKNQMLLADRLNLKLVDDDVKVSMAIYHPQDKFERGYMAEVALAMITRLIVEILGIKGSLSAVEFKHSCIGSLETYESFFRVPVFFERPQNKLEFHKNTLSLPVSHSNIELFAYVEQHFEMVLRRISKSGYPADIARLRDSIIDNAKHGEFGATSAAARAGLSLRAAQRLAALHGTSLKALIDEVRVAIANEVLVNKDIDIETVAMIAGYSDERAFRRAYERLTGRTPAKFRQSV